MVKEKEKERVRRVRTLRLGHEGACMGQLARETEGINARKEMSDAKKVFIATDNTIEKSDEVKMKMVVDVGDRIEVSVARIAGCLWMAVTVRAAEQN